MFLFGFFSFFFYEHRLLSWQLTGFTDTERTVYPAAAATPERQWECARLKFTAFLFSNVTERVHKKPVGVIREP